jgi:hypothetical protein
LARPSIAVAERLRATIAAVNDAIIIPIAKAAITLSMP